MTSAHAKPTHQSVTPLGKIITSKNLIPSRRPNKEMNPTRSFGAPNTLPRKSNMRRITKSFIEWTNVKPAILPKMPPGTILNLPHWGLRFNQVQELNNGVHLPIIEITHKSHIPNHNTILPDHHFIQESILMRCTFKKIGKCILKGQLTTPAIIPQPKRSSFLRWCIIMSEWTTKDTS